MSQRSSKPEQARKVTGTSRRANEFIEWRFAGDAWRGCFENTSASGFCLEWIDSRSNERRACRPVIEEAGYEVWIQLRGACKVYSARESVSLPSEAWCAASLGSPEGRRIQFLSSRSAALRLWFGASFMARHLGGEFPQPSQASKVVGPCGKMAASGLSLQNVRFLSMRAHSRLVLLRQQPPLDPLLIHPWLVARAIDLMSLFLFERGALNSVEGSGPGIVRSRLEPILGAMEADPASVPSLDAMAAQLEMSRFHLCRLFHQELGKPLRKHLQELRLKKAASLIQAGWEPSSASLAVGYRSLAYFRSAFRKAFGSDPNENDPMLPERNSEKERPDAPSRPPLPKSL